MVLTPDARMSVVVASLAAILAGCLAGPAGGPQDGGDRALVTRTIELGPDGRCGDLPDGTCEARADRIVLRDLRVEDRSEGPDTALILDNLTRSVVLENVRLSGFDRGIDATGTWCETCRVAVRNATIDTTGGEPEAARFGVTVGVRVAARGADVDLDGVTIRTPGGGTYDETTRSQFGGPRGVAVEAVSTVKLRDVRVEAAAPSVAAGVDLMVTTEASRIDLPFRLAADNLTVAGFRNGIRSLSSGDDPFEQSPLRTTLRDVNVSCRDKALDVIGGRRLTVDGFRTSGCRMVGADIGQITRVFVSDLDVTNSSIGLRIENLATLEFRLPDPDAPTDIHIPWTFNVDDAVLSDNGVGLHAHRMTNLTVTGSTFRRNGPASGWDHGNATGAMRLVDANVEVRRSRFVDNRPYAVDLGAETGCMHDQTCTDFALNWWNDPRGPRVETDGGQVVGVGDGEIVEEGVQFAPFLIQDPGK